MNQNQKQSPHTPGPWTRDGDFIWDKNGDYLIARVAYGNLDNEADARLIAAAPDLLDTVERLRNRLETICRVYTDRDVIPQLHDCVEITRSALARARGEDTPAR